MKKLEIIFKTEKLEDLKTILEEANVNGLNIVNIIYCSVSVAIVLPNIIDVERGDNSHYRSNTF